MAGDVSFGVLVRDDLVVLAERDDHGALELAHGRMGRVDAGVEDAHAHAGSGRAAERPVAGDALGPVRGQGDPVDGILGQAPRGQRRLARVPAVSGHVLHGIGLYGARPVPSDPAQLSLKRSRSSSMTRRSGS